MCSILYIFVVQKKDKMAKDRVLQARFSAENVIAITAKTELLYMTTSSYIRMCVLKDLSGTASVVDREGNTVSGRVIEVGEINEVTDKIVEIFEDDLDWQKDAKKRNKKTK